MTAGRPTASRVSGQLIQVTAAENLRETQQFRIYRPRSPYLYRDAERAYLTQIIKDDDLAFAFRAHRFFRWE